jgi:inosine/xanthosine triphosphatase
MAGVRAQTVTVGSTNPIKVAAVREVVRLLFPGYVVEGVAVSSGVGDQPQTDRETLQGAMNRAQGAMARRSAEYGVGIESGVERVENRLFGFTWVAVRSGDGDTGLGCSARIEIPPRVASLLHQGAELDEGMRKLTGIRGLGRAEGAMGLLTQSHVTRGDAIRHALHFAFARFTSRAVYAEE